MRPILAAVVALLVATAIPAAAERRRTVAPAVDALSISFVEAGSSDASIAAAGSDAWLDLATVKHRGGDARATRIRNRFGMRIEGVSAASSGVAVVTAHLESWDGRATYRLDGHTLGTAPIVIEPRAAIGAVAWHTLEIEISTGAPEGPLATTIRWEVRSE